MCPAVRKEKFTIFINLALNFYYQTSIVEQSSVQIYIKQAMTTSKLHTKFCGSLINARGSLFVWFSFVLV